MKTRTFLPGVILLLGTLFSIHQAWAQEEEDRTLSPYFFVMSTDTAVDQMPLKATSADVRISGVIAGVTVRQTYCNEGDSVLEAIYVFPASTRAAVHYMQMSLGNRILIAQIKEKEEAREIYEEAKEEGKTVSLLEQDRPNVFRMSVGNILPGDTIQVEMRYTELLVPLDGEYEFVYPTVVGPRYVSPSEDGEEWTETPYQHEGEDPLYDFHLDVCINAGMAIKEIYSPSHPGLTFSAPVDHTASTSADLKGNKDVVIRYRLSGSEIESGLLTWEGEDENFFLAMFQPPRNPQDYQIPPREYVFIMDVSGSMHGFPIEVSKALLRDLVGGLRPQDRFNLEFFAGGNYVLSPVSLPATRENIDMALLAIDEKQGGGGTELLSALTTALSLPETEDYSRTFVIATDGYVSVERQAFDLILNNLGTANFFAFGIGSSVNRYIIEGIAHVGMGEPFIVLNEGEAEASAARFRQYISNPVLTNIGISFSNFGAYEVEPPNVPDVFAERPVIFFGKYSGDPSGEIRVTGLSGNSAYSETLEVGKFPPDPGNDALRYLWARHKIQLLDDYAGAFSWYGPGGQDYADSIKAVVTDLGLKYNLLTQYTSFVAVDSIVRTDSGSAVTVKQPLPLPEGVSDYAVGDAGYYGGAASPYGFTSGTAQTSFVGGKGPGAGSGQPDPEVSGIGTVYPNPFGKVAMLRVYIHALDADLSKTLMLFSATGQLLDVIRFDPLEEGWHILELDFGARYPELPSGLYLAVLCTGDKKCSPARLQYVKH